MKLAVMQPYYFPYIGAYQLVNAVDKYIIYGDFNFRNDGWFHRNRLLEKGKAPLYFNVRLLSSSYKKKFAEIEVDPTSGWRNKLMRTIEQNYRRAKFYETIIEEIRNIVMADFQYLSDFNANTMIRISQFLDIKTSIIHPYTRTEEIENLLDEEYDFSNGIENIVDKKTARILEICKQEKASEYINPIGGTSLYSKETFSKHGIDLFFLQTANIQYKQLSDLFEPNLSIIDVLMNCGKEQTSAFLDCYILI